MATPFPAVPVPTTGEKPIQSDGHFTKSWYRFFLGLSSQVMSAGFVVASAALKVNQLILGAGSNAIKAVPAQDGQVPIGRTVDGAVVLNRLTAGGGIAITNGPGSVTIRATGLGGSFVPLSLGVEPLQFVSDGAGVPILVAL